MLYLIKMKQEAASFLEKQEEEKLTFDHYLGGAILTIVLAAGAVAVVNKVIKRIKHKKREIRPNARKSQTTLVGDSLKHGTKLRASPRNRLRVLRQREVHLRPTSVSRRSLKSRMQAGDVSLESQMGIEFIPPPGSLTREELLGGNRWNSPTSEELAAGTARLDAGWKQECEPLETYECRFPLNISYDTYYLSAHSDGELHGDPEEFDNTTGKNIYSIYYSQLGWVGAGLDVDKVCDDLPIQLKKYRDCAIPKDIKDYLGDLSACGYDTTYDHVGLQTPFLYVPGKNLIPNIQFCGNSPTQTKANSKAIQCFLVRVANDTLLTQQQLADLHEVGDERYAYDPIENYSAHKDVMLTNDHFHQGRCYTLADVLKAVNDNYITYKGERDDVDALIVILGSCRGELGSYSMQMSESSDDDPELDNEVAALLARRSGGSTSQV